MTGGVFVAFFDCPPRADVQDERGLEETIWVYEVRWKDEAQR